MATANRRHDCGAAVEAAAAVFLQAQGLVPLDSNAHARGGELDLVMRDGSTVVFVEVRYRAHAAFGGAAASVDVHKRRKLVHAAQAYLTRHPDVAEAPCRFDVIAASGEPASPQFDWLRDAFRADEC